MDFGVRDGHNQHHKRSNTPQLLRVYGMVLCSTSSRSYYSKRTH